MVVFHVYGCVHDWNTFYCESLCKKIVDKLDDGSSTVKLFVDIEVQYLQKLNQLKEDNLPALLHYTKTNLVLRDNEILGDILSLIKIALEQYGIEDAEVANTVVFNRLVRETSYEAYRSIQNPLMSIQFRLGSGSRLSDTEDLGSIIVELLADHCPQAVSNFQQLCDGYRDLDNNKFLKYENSLVHRIVKNGWLQTGDLIDGSGKNSRAVVNPSGAFSDESFAVDFGFPLGGILGYANEGPHCNGSQFFITLGPCAWMNKKFVGFGRVLQGFGVLRRINVLPTSNQCPLETLKVGLCVPPHDLKSSGSAGQGH